MTWSKQLTGADCDCCERRPVDIGYPEKGGFLTSLVCKECYTHDMRSDDCPLGVVE